MTALDSCLKFSFGSPLQVVSSLDDTIVRLKGELIQSEEKCTGLEMKLGDAVHEIADTQKEVTKLLLRHSFWPFLQSWSCAHTLTHIVHALSS